MVPRRKVLRPFIGMKVLLFYRRVLNAREILSIDRIGIIFMVIAAFIGYGSKILLKRY